MMGAIAGRRGRRVLGAGVELDGNLHVLGDLFGDDGDQKLVPEPGEQR
jgi:hypothetical protein